MKKVSLVLILLVALPGIAIKNAFAQTEIANSEAKQITLSNSGDIVQEFYITQEQTLFRGQLVFNLADGVLTFSYINSDLDNIVLSIKDELGNELFRDMVRKKPLMHHRLSVSELPEGEYHAYVRVGNNFLKQKFNIVD